MLAPLRNRVNGNLLPLGRFPPFERTDVNTFDAGYAGRDATLVRMKSFASLVAVVCVVFLSGCSGSLSYEEELARSEAYLAEAAARGGALTTPSGLVYRELEPGSGPMPMASNTVSAHYRGTLVDGTEFDSSLGGDPLEIPLTRVIPCWTEGLQLMRVGGKSELVCPAAIAYGEQGAPPDIPGGAALIFEVELLEIVQ